MAERFSIGKLLGGFNPFVGKNLGKIIFVGVIAAFTASLALGVYHKITKPTSNTETTIGNVESGGTVVVNEPIKIPEPKLNHLGVVGFGTSEDEQGVGVAYWRDF